MNRVATRPSHSASRLSGTQESSSKPRLSSVAELSRFGGEHPMAEPHGATTERPLALGDTSEHERCRPGAAEPRGLLEQDLTQHGQVVIIAQPFFEALQCAGASPGGCIQVLEESYVIPVIFQAPAPEMKLCGIRVRADLAHRVSRPPIASSESFPYGAGTADVRDDGDERLS